MTTRLRIVATLALAFVLTLALLAIAGAGTTPGPAGPRLAVVVSGADSTEVVTIGPNGEEPRRLVRGTFDELIPFFEHPNWSADGKSLAFYDQGDETPAVALLGADGSNLHLLRSSEHPGGPDNSLLPEPLFDPKGGNLFVAVVHTPNGEGLFGDRRPAGRRGPIRIEYWRLSVDGRKARRLSSRTLGRRRPLIPFPFSISSSGKIAATALTRRGFAVVTVDPRSGATRTVVPTTTQEEGSLEPAISPDGTQIAYKVDDQKEVGGRRILIGTDLMIVPSAGGKPKLIARVRGGARWPTWDPSGSRLAFTALDAAGLEDFPGGQPGDALMEVNPDGTCLTKVFSIGEEGAVEGAAWQPGADRGAGPISC